MNGTPGDIRIVRPFGDAIELTKQILFRPFDLKKWFVIGFAAWLSHLGSNYSFNYRAQGGGDLRHNPVFQGLTDTIHRTPVWIIVLVAAILLLIIICLAVLFAWLRARGRFMFMDCVVRNRAAIAEPWREFRKLGNSFFLVSLLVSLGFFFFAALLAAPWAILLVRGRLGHDYQDLFLIAGLVLWVCAVFVFAIAWGLIAHLMIPIMYRRRCLAPEGFRAAISLINNYPGEFIFYCLFWILVGIGSVIVMCAGICLTCCIAALPYIGTVILLPMFVCLRGFSLLFLRQFGSDYDVWAAALPPSPAAPEPPPVPPPVPL